MVAFNNKLYLLNSRTQTYYSTNTIEHVVAGVLLFPSPSFPVIKMRLRFTRINNMSSSSYFTHFFSLWLSIFLFDCKKKSDTSASRNLVHALLGTAPALLLFTTPKAFCRHSICHLALLNRLHSIHTSSVCFLFSLSPLPLYLFLLTHNS